MIKAEVKRNGADIVSIKVSGHAGSAPKGEDLVCAGVSAIICGIMNTLDQKGYLAAVTYQLQEGYFDLSVIHRSKELQLILETLEISLLTVEETYADYIKINEMEV